jgi:hypothetical protein
MISEAQWIIKYAPAVRAVLKDQGAANQLSKLLSKADLVAKDAEEFQEWRRNLPFQEADRASALAQRTDTNRKALLSHANFIVGIQADGDRLKLSEAIANAEAALKAVVTIYRQWWQAGITEEFSGLLELANLLDAIPRASKAATQLREAAKLSEAAQKALIPRAAEREKLSRARTKRDEGLALLMSSGANMNVLSFLRAVALQTANLELVNDEVLDWLKETGQLKHFRVFR